MPTGLRIAVADDEALIRRYFEDILPEMGHTVVASAENGRQLVNQCCQLHPDLVITDVKMPELDGIDATMEIFRQFSVPVILVSAYHDTDLIERAEASSVLAYLIKPVQRADLETAIAIAMRRFRQMESLEKDAAELRQHLEERKLIERAKGVIMQRTGLSEGAAHQRLQKTACDTNQKLVDVARLVLAAEPALDLFSRKSSQNS
jgi:response regulator NasT